MPNAISFGAGGSPSSGRSITGASRVTTFSMFTYPTGNVALDGSRPIGNTSVSLNGSFGGGYTGAGVDNNGGNADVFISSNGSFTTLTGYIGNGFNMTSNTGVTFSGGFQGTFFYSTVAFAPASISVSRTGRSVAVSSGASTLDGGEPITSYQVQFRTSTDNSSWGAWGNTQTLDGSRNYTYNSLTPALWYQFRTFANNLIGSSEGRVSSSVFVPAGGKRWDGSVWQPTSVARRWNGSAWVDISTAKRWNGSAWVDLS